MSPHSFWGQADHFTALAAQESLAPDAAETFGCIQRRPPTMNRSTSPRVSCFTYVVCVYLHLHTYRYMCMYVCVYIYTHTTSAFQRACPGACALACTMEVPGPLHNKSSQKTLQPAPEQPVWVQHPSNHSPLL